MRKYLYIWFNEGNRTKDGVNKDEYNYMCTEDLQGEKNITIVPYPLSHLNYYLYFLFAVCRKIDRKIFKKATLERLWYPFYFKKIKDKEAPLCFIISGYYIQPDYLRYLRKKFPKAKIVKTYRDTYKFWRSANKNFTDDDIKELFDMQFSYDKGDSSKYGMIHFDEFASKNQVAISDNYPLYDVFFAGVVKDRLEKLVSIYDYLTANGIKCWFFLTKIGNKPKIEREGITYSDTNMSYKDMLYYTVNSKVVLEVNQKDADGFTSRFLESVMYNKKLLTDNKSIVFHKYYIPEYIQYFDAVQDINVDFIKNNCEVNYQYQGEFSPKHLINLIDNSLIKMDKTNEIKCNNK